MNEDHMDDDATWLDAGLDGELDAARSLALERRLAADPAFRARWEARRALRGAVREAASYHEAPRGLRAKVEAALQAEGSKSPGAAEPMATAMPARTPKDAPPRSDFPPGASRGATARGRHPARSWTWPWLLASGFGGAFAAALSTLLFFGPQALRGHGGDVRLVALASTGPEALPDGLAAEAVSAHTRAMLVGETIEVASSDRHTVRPWLAARLNFVPAIEDFAPQGYALSGARRDVIGGETAAALVYRHGAHVISVFVRPLRGAASAPIADEPPTLRTVRGFNVVEMTHAGMAYSLVSDMNAREMAELAQLLRGPAT